MNKYSISKLVYNPSDSGLYEKLCEMSYKANKDRVELTEEAENWRIDAENYRNERDELSDVLAEITYEKMVLTDENEAWQKQLISTEEKSGKAYYDLACEVEDLREENERLRVVADMSDTTLTDALRIVNEFCDSRIKRARADTVREMQERIKAEKFHHKNFGDLVYLEDIGRIADEFIKEINKGEAKNEEDSDTI